ncbi:hypothetical protein CFS9_39500 [Flavobacterium sp. CFS9]|uniref:Uncharacterized protein n=1 Tax=Flavobacterium sp. CFS9 TaxID=3143118 RepID=A0AAT9H7C3_9FLAO
MKEQLIADLAPYLENYDRIKEPLTQVFRQNNTLSTTEKEIFEEASRAWEAYLVSTDGQELKFLISESDLPGIQQKLKSIFDSKVFEILKILLEKTGLDAGSFSIGLNIEAEFFLGFTVTIGLALGVGINKGVSSCEFLSVGLTEGIDEGVLVGVQFGLWSNAPADLGGFSLATEVDLGLGVEIATKVVYEAKGSSKILGVTAEIGVGEEDGVNEQEIYTFVFGTQDLGGFFRKTYQTERSNLLIIESIKCIHPKNDGTGDENEIFFTFRADNITNPYYYPTYDYMSMKEGYTWNCGRSIWFDETIEIFLYDDDGNGVRDSDIITEDPIRINVLDFKSTPSKVYKIDYKDGLDNIEYEITATLIANHK